MQGPGQVPQGCSAFLFIDLHCNEFPLCCVTLQRCSQTVCIIFTWEVSFNTGSAAQLRQKDIVLYCCPMMAIWCCPLGTMKRMHILRQLFETVIPWPVIITNSKVTVGYLFTRLHAAKWATRAPEERPSP